MFSMPLYHIMIPWTVEKKHFFEAQVVVEETHSHVVRIGGALRNYSYMSTTPRYIK